jgi:hypothetical protein
MMPGPPSPPEPPSTPYDMGNQLPVLPVTVASLRDEMPAWH